jgi:hypothetical protein
MTNDFLNHLNGQMTRFDYDTLKNWGLRLYYHQYLETNIYWDWFFNVVIEV